MNGCIRRMNPDGSSNIVAGAARRETDRDGTGKFAGFKFPHGISQDAVGNLYVADTLNHLIRKVSPSGKVSRFAGGGSKKLQKKGGGESGHIDGPSRAARFDCPYALAVVDDIVYVADSRNFCIRRIKGGRVTTLAGGFSGMTLGEGIKPGMDGHGTSASFVCPRGLAADRSAIYVCDVPVWDELPNSEKLPHVIRRITPDGEVSRAAGGLSGMEDGSCSSAKFQMPQGVAVGPSGHVYISDTLNFKVRRLSPRGNVVTLMGLGGYSSWADGVGVESHFRGPHGIALDAKRKRMYIADTFNHMVRRASFRAKHKNGGKEVDE
eukprot:jgi/Bigna1/68845/fgenesh1_pg.7_\